MAKLRSFLILLGGIVLMLAAKPFSHFVLPAASRFIAPLDYALEHIGVVVVVAILVRATLEAASQREFVSVVSNRVREQLHASMTDLTARLEETSLRPLEDKVKSLTQRLSYKIVDVLGDERLRRELDSAVLNPKFIRPEYTLHLTLRPLTQQAGEHRDLLRVAVGNRYAVQNLDTQANSYPVVSWLDDVIHFAGIPDGGPLGFSRISIGTYSLNVEELEERGEIRRQDGVVHLHTNTHSIPPGDSLVVELHGEQLMRTEDHFVWNLVTLTRKLEVVIELAGGLTFDHLNVFPRAMHHVDYDAFLQTRDASKPNTHTYRLDQTLLPYQGVEIRWSPKPAAPAASADGRGE